MLTEFAMTKQGPLFKHRFLKYASLSLTMAMLIVSAWSTPAYAQSTIRDAEIESLLRVYTYPLFRAAGLTPRNVKVHIVNNNSINAFVAGGQRIFVHTGLLLESESPSVVIGVLAHETGHIAGGHLSRLHRQLEKAQTTAIIGILVGAAAAIGGAAAGANTGGAATGVLLGGQEFARRGLLSYQRAQEASADQAAVRYLEATGQSARGMIILFEKLANQAIASLRTIDPYVLSHPMPRDRIALLERLARKSRHFNKPDDPALVFRHKMMQAKLRGFLQHPRIVARYYPDSKKTLPARYARAIAHFRKGAINKSLAELEVLQKALPKNPYIWELKGQAYLETGQVRAAIGPLNRAVELAPNSGLLRILLAQALIATNNRTQIDKAINHLKFAKRTEINSISLHRHLASAYGKKKQVGKATLSSAEAAFVGGDYKLAKAFAKRAKPRLKRGTPLWQRANDILTFVPPKRG